MALILILMNMKGYMNGDVRRYWRCKLLGRAYEYNTKKGIRSGRLSDDAACKKHP